MRILPLLPLLLASACASVLPEQPKKYTLAPELTAASAPATDIRFTIARPDGAFGLESEHIQLEQENGAISYIRGAAWVSPLPELLQDSLRAQLERTAPGLITTGKTGTLADVTLYTTIERFTVRYSAAQPAPTVEISLSAYWVDAASGELHRLSLTPASAVAAGNRVGAIMDAFNQAYASILGQYQTQIGQIAARKQADRCRAAALAPSGETPRQCANGDTTPPAATAADPIPAISAGNP